MGRIGATLTGIERTLLNRLAEANAAVVLNNLRLATDQKINVPADDPAGFFALDTFRSRLSIVTKTLTNVTAATKQVSDSQAALDEIRTQLGTIRTNAVADEDQTLTADQRAANQAAIDAAINRINELATTKFGTRRLLDGSASFQTTGVNAAQVSTLEVYQRGGVSSPTISGTVTSAATQGTLTHTGAGGNIVNTATLTLSGARGSTSITVNAAEALTTARDRINAESHITGVEASVAGNDLVFTTIEYGSDAQVTVEVTSGGPFATAGTGIGTDATATINGQDVTGDGNVFFLNDNGLSFRVEFASGSSGAFDTVTVSGDALRYAVATELYDTATLSIPGVQAARLGGLSGTLDQLFTGGSSAGLGSNAVTAVRIVDEALGDLNRIEGLVDGFATASLASSSNLLTALEENLNTAIDSINDVDETEESLLLAKNQTLAANATAGLSILAQQRTNILKLVQQAAGFSV